MTTTDPSPSQLTFCVAFSGNANLAKAKTVRQSPNYGLPTANGSRQHQSSMTMTIFPLLQHPAKTTILERADFRNWANALEKLSDPLDRTFRISDPIPLPTETNSSCNQLRICAFSHGEVSYTSIQGFGFAVHLDPIQARCTLALPADGQACCRINEHELACTAGQAIGFLPARSWQLTNSCPAGLGVHCTEEALLTRLMAMCGHEMPVPTLRRLTHPLLIELTDVRSIAAYQQLLLALGLLEEIIVTTNEMPHPFLCLDDLILRSITLILFPEISAHLEIDDAAKDKNSLQLTVRELMAWMLSNIDQPISLTDIEAHTNYGRRSIQAGFRQEVGCGPMQWLRRKRLETAYHQLQSAPGDLSVTAVARQCGYLSLSNFSRDFTELFKRTPSSVLRHAKRSDVCQP